MIAKKKVPFEFILDRLVSLNPIVKPMFGCHAVYVAEKIVLALRHKPDHTESNGIWLATSKEHHDSLRIILPEMRSIEVLSKPGEVTGWQMIHDQDEKFEESAIIICDLILKNDTRIGKVPKPKKKVK